MGSIYQSIELLSKEKGIETQIVLDAVKDALLVAARKHYRTNENYIAELNEKSGAIDLFAVKKVVEAVENPAVELTLQEARKIDPAAELESEIRIPESGLARERRPLLHWPTQAPGEQGSSSMSRVPS